MTGGGFFSQRPTGECGVFSHPPPRTEKNLLYMDGFSADRFCCRTRVQLKVETQLAYRVMSMLCRLIFLLWELRRASAVGWAGGGRGVGGGGAQMWVLLGCVRVR